MRVRLAAAGRVGRAAATAVGQVRLALRQPWRDGTTAVVFDPVEFLGRLAVLEPRPRINLLPYYGVLGARAAWRREVVPAPARAAAPEAAEPGPAQETSGHPPPKAPAATGGSRRRC